VLSCANGERMHEALSALELMVSLDLFRNETGNLAHYLLPVTSFLERADLPMGIAGFQPVPYAQLAAPVVSARGESKDEWWIFAQLAEACAAPLMKSRLLQRWFYASTAARSWLPSWLRFTPGWLYALVAGSELLSLRALRKRPHGVLLASYAGGQFAKTGVLTRDRKVQLAPTSFVSAASGLARSELEQLARRGSLRLITKREKTSHNSWMHNIEAFVRGPRSTNYLYMHPDDAASRSLANGDLCQVKTPTGSVQVPVKLSDELMRGSVALPHGWGHQRADGLAVAARTRGVNANVLAPDGSGSLDPLSGMSQLTALEVQVERASPEIEPIRG
jgi:anaerobic selenocysteine-containing dehydrogenase